MAITLQTNARNAAASAVGTLLNGGTIVFQTAASATAATVTFNATAFGAPATGTITANAITADTNVVGGTITKFEARNSSAAVVFTGTVTATGGGGDITLSSVTLAAGEKLEVTSFTYTQPA